MTTLPFAKAMKDNMKTDNGAESYGFVDNTGEYEGRLGWFFKGIRGLNQVFGYDYLKKATNENIVDAFCLVMNTRDILEGKGERELGRKSFQWLLINFPDEMEKVIELIPHYGRWDDLYQLFPKQLKLGDLDWVNNNYCSSIDLRKLIRAREVQMKVVEFFSRQLSLDYQKMREGKPISLAAKWCETEGSSDDKKYDLVSTHCQYMKLHPKGYRIRVGEMRSYLNVVENKCCNKQWDEIDYSKVPAQTMKKLKKAFMKNDGERFRDFLNKLKTGDKSVKINAKTLQPHELVTSYINMSPWSFVQQIPIDNVVEEQWKELVNTTKKFGMLDKAIVVTDVSGSMYWGQNNGPKPILVSIALSILIAQTSKAPWNNSVLAFSAEPTWHTINGETLFECCKQIQQIPQGYNTNFYKVFQQILYKYDKYNLKPEDLPEKIIVISDMQFDIAGDGGTNLEEINKLFKTRGLKRPTLIFWNVNSGLDFPATAQNDDLCLIGGFSQSIMTTLTTMSKFSPLCVVREVIDKSRYDSVRECLTKE